MFEAGAPFSDGCPGFAGGGLSMHAQGLEAARVANSSKKQSRHSALMITVSRVLTSSPPILGGEEGLEVGAIASVRHMFPESILARERNIDFGLKPLAFLGSSHWHQTTGLNLCSWRTHWLYG